MMSKGRRLSGRGQRDWRTILPNCKNRAFTPHLPRRIVGAKNASAGGCGSSPSKCPKPAVYDDATLKKIEKAREALPKDSILLQVMEDYENERDDLRFCR